MSNKRNFLEMEYKLLTTVQVAEMLQLHPQYVRDLARYQKIKARKVGRRWLFKEEDVEYYLNSFRQPNF